MHRALEIDEKASVDARIALIRAELELRMFKLMFINAIFAVALVALVLLPTLRGPVLVFFLGGSAAQAYAVWRM